MGFLGQLVRRQRRAVLPYDMFDVTYGDREARRARRMESIYHVGQNRIWDGRAVLAELLAKHGRPRMAHEQRAALSRIFSIIMWGELGAWKISAQLTDALEPFEPKLAAASQVHDEARHFYVMHDYLEALGEQPRPLDFWSRHVVEMTLATDDLAKKLLGMQLTIEVVALTIFQLVREIDVEPILSELLVYYERDEARHVGLGTQLVPRLVAEMSVPERVSLGVFQVELLGSMVFSLKAMEKDLLSIGVDPREVLAIGFRKQQEITKTMRDEFPSWPEDPPVDRLFDGLCEGLFPTAGAGARVPWRDRIGNAIAVTARAREGVIQVKERERAERRAARSHASEPPAVVPAVGEAE